MQFKNPKVASLGHSVNGQHCPLVANMTNHSSVFLQWPQARAEIWGKVPGVRRINYQTERDFDIFFVLFFSLSIFPSSWWKSESSWRLMGKLRNNVTVQSLCMCDLRRPANVYKLRSADFTRVSSYSLHMFHDNPGKTLFSQSQTELETLIQKSE